VALRYYPKMFQEGLRQAMEDLSKQPVHASRFQSGTSGILNGNANYLATMRHVESWLNWNFLIRSNFKYYRLLSPCEELSLLLKHTEFVANEFVGHNLKPSHSRHTFN
jgi:hypothetical protein